MKRVKQSEEEKAPYNLTLKTMQNDAWFSVIYRHFKGNLNETFINRR